MESQFNNKFFRVYAVVTDNKGIDPLLDRIVPLLQQITSYTVHEVVQDERGSPDLISLREYGADHYWWHIMSYNGVCRFRDIVEGSSLKIPDIGALIALTNRVMVETSNQQPAIRTATI